MGADLVRDGVDQFGCSPAQTAVSSVQAKGCGNDKGQHPKVALDVILEFRNELLALCPWFERIGLPADAERLRKSCADAMRLPDYVELPAFARDRT